MKHVEQNGEWSLFCLNEAPNIHEVHGVEFEELYTRYEPRGRKAALARLTLLKNSGMVSSRLKSKLDLRLQLENGE